ncbi:MAG: histidinol-phosphate transaminase [Candidatus Syntrophoarchaeum sp.]|nr:histidinol-phosphate transaminase [Candidatus Syntrophoarchaeum sp.]
MNIKMRVPVRSSLMEIEDYKPGESVKGAIKLSSNENPLGPSPKVVKEIVKSIEEGELNLSVYPWERNEEELRDEISRYVGVGASIGKENIVIGAGVDGVLDTLVKIFIEIGDEALIPIPTFSLYESLVKIAGGMPGYVKRKSGEFGIPLDELIPACNEKTKMIFISSPNNPTGNCIPEAEMRAIIESVPKVMVVIDEAYVEFADSSLVNLVKEYENVLVLRTFSKAFGLAGLRVGYAVIPEWLASAYKKVSIPFSVNSIAIKAAIVALRDKEHLRKSVKLVRHERELLLENLQRFLKVYPSQANFVLVDVSPRKSYEAYEELMKNGLIVRDCASFRGAGDSFIRITVGTREQNELVVETLKQISS